MKRNMVISGLMLVWLSLSLCVASAWAEADGEAGKKQASETSGKDSGQNAVVLILDASGSMWGQINGKAKTVIAREVLNELIDSLAADLRVGLSAYGHRREKDCQDIEMLIPVGPPDPAAMKTKIAAIKPKGKTPLSDAVKQAATALNYSKQRATVVLVSDGLETCNADPCALAAELARTGMDFKVHVIGFDISKEDQGRLRCLADKTGGLFLPAGDAQSLRSALSHTMAKVQEPPPPVVADPGTASLKGPETVAAGSVFEVTWEGPDSRGDFIAIARQGSKDTEYLEYAYTIRGNPARIVSPGEPGPHELRYVHAHSGKVIGRAAIAVTPVQAAVQPPATVPAAGIFQVSWQGPSYEIDYISIAEPSAPAGIHDNYVYTQNGNPAKLTAPATPGTYEVRYIMGHGTRILARNSITVEAASAAVKAPESVSTAAKFQVEWQGPNNVGDYISVAIPSDPPTIYDNYTYTSNGNPAGLTAPTAPGTYEVRYVMGKDNTQLAKATLTVAAVSAEVKPPKSVPAGSSLQVPWQGPDNAGDHLAIAAPDDPPDAYDNYTYTSNGNPAGLTAPAAPGTYEVRYIMGKDNSQLVKATLTVTAVSAEVKPPAAVNANARFQVKWQGPDYEGDYLTVVTPDAPADGYDNYTYTSNGNPAELTAPAVPGTYEVRYIIGRGNHQLAKATLTVK